MMRGPATLNGNVNQTGKGEPQVAFLKAEPRAARPGVTSSNWYNRIG